MIDTRRILISLGIVAPRGLDVSAVNGHFVVTHPGIPGAAVLDGDYKKVGADFRSEEAAWNYASKAKGTEQ